MLAIDFYTALSHNRGSEDEDRGVIRVIIEREIAEGLEQFYESAIANLNETMAEFPGYASGESLKNLRHPNRYVVITRWQNEESWNRWYHSETRREKLAELRPFLLTDEKITLLRQLGYYRVDESNS